MHTIRKEEKHQWPTHASQQVRKISKLSVKKKEGNKS